jgi:outer membrane protein
MDVLRDTAALGLRKHNLAVLGEQLRVVRNRAAAGMATIADVAQAEAARAQAQADVAAARQALATSLVDYREATGESPQRLEPAPSCEARLPEKVDGAFERAEAENPQLVAALHQAEAAKFGVDAALGALSPTLSIGAQVFQQYDSYLGYPGTRQFSAQVTGMLNIPLYEGGAEYASVRQARQQLSQAQSHLSALSSVIRSKLAAAYSRLETAKAAMRFGAVNIRAAEQALSAVRDEAEVGQRTFLDVLNAQQALLDARVKMVAAQHDRVVASYAALAGIGGLTASRLGLAVDVYDPARNFEAVRGLWFGLDTPQEP